MMNDFENELDNIRVSLYEKSKDLSQEVFISQMNAQARVIAEQFGFTIIASVNDAEPPKRKTAI